MYTREQILERLRKKKPELQEKYPLSELALFGSYARGDQTETSDIDILVGLGGRIGGFRYVELAHELQALFDSRVDVVSRRAIRPQFMPFVEKNLIHV